MSQISGFLKQAFTHQLLRCSGCCQLLSLAELTLTAFNRPPDLAMLSRAKVAGLAFRGHRH